jgi:propanol-preferring alcohol dehydrogenase
MSAIPGTTMNAVVLSELGAPPGHEQVELPRPGVGQVLVRVEACGLCGIDVGVAMGEWPEGIRLPRVLGHETVGRVVALGAAVGDLHEGERVVLPRLAWACGRCEHCLGGLEALCGQRRYAGLDVDGGFADYQLAEADFALSVPRGVDPLDAACLSCAGATAYRAVRAAGVRPGDVTAVWGVGGIGHLALQYARMAGASVVAVDCTPDKLVMARDLGARDVVDDTNEDPVAALARRGGARQVIFAASRAEAMPDALRALRPGGRLVMVAVPGAGTLELPVAELIRDGISVLGAIGANRLDVTRALALHAGGQTRVVHQARSISQVDEAIIEVREHRAPARLVFEMR